MFRRRERTARRGGQVCPLCREALTDQAGELRTCAGCEAVYHGDCVRELGGGACATAGCGRALTAGEDGAEVEGIRVTPIEAPILASQDSRLSDVGYGALYVAMTAFLAWGSIVSFREGQDGTTFMLGLGAMACALFAVLFFRDAAKPRPGD